MDHQLIKQYGTDILSYRLRTARQKQRMRYTDFDRQLIKLHNKRQELGMQIRNLGWVPLTPPVQRGYKRIFVLRADVAKSKQAEFYAGILNKVNTVQYSSSKVFKTKKRKQGRKVYVDRIQHLQQLTDWAFERLQLTIAEKQCFYELWQTNQLGQNIKYYVIAEPWRFVLKVMPNLIDKTRIKDSLLEAQEKELDNYLSKNGYIYRLDKLLDSGRSGWKTGKPIDKDNVLRNKGYSERIWLIEQ